MPAPKYCKEIYDRNGIYDPRFVVTGLNSLDMIMITDIVNLPSGKISKLNKAGVIETAMGIPCLF